MTGDRKAKEREVVLCEVCLTCLATKHAISCLQNLTMLIGPSTWHIVATSYVQTCQRENRRGSDEAISVIFS
jgi:hypothetical protein